MDQQQAKKLIHETFNSAFDRMRFIKFVKELLNEIDESKHGRWAGQMIKGGFGDDVKYYERIGTYTAPDGEKIDILVVYLKKESTLERARTKQRNFVAHHLKTRAEKDAGLVAFVSPNTDDWRFSLVKMEYNLEQTQEGKVKVEENLTPAKRFSFIVGKNENSHTAQKQLLPILEDDKNNPTLKEIEKAFSIEAVTKEFFNKYKDLFLNFKEEFDKILEKDKKITEDFSDRGINTADFAKKLLGQIVFLYFLQRKGWLGVDKNSNWGSGPKNFLRALFEKKYADYKNFFNDILEPLFYEALATDRGDKAYYSRFDCRIPFLNGGLFEPIQNYDWENTDIIIPNDLFSNDVPTKEGDKGSGILDFFDRYNFTIKEDEPLEKEVAIDPEMLGKVFENLLEIKDRKSKGAYYTPREIVHYMCQESLINYLATESENKLPREDIETFIHLGDFAVEHDMAKTQGIIKDDGKYKLPHSIHKNAELIDRKLADITVCDPAIGSGAFPVGMMNEIIRARGALNATKSFKDTKSKRTPYSFKRHAIQNSLYGVDIDPGAVEIAKLRLWLSLVVDEEEMTEIKPLPNLDYKIMQGNSLLEEYEGIKLFDESLLGVKKGLKDATQMTIGDFEGKQGEARKKLEKLHEQFFESSQRTDKKEIKKQIDELEWELIEETLKEQGKEKELPKLQVLRRSNNKPFFLWKLHFAEVFQKKGGFDVVMGNPPYGIRFTKSDNPQLANQYRNIFKGEVESYILFYYRGLTILHQKGYLCYITPDSWFTNKGAGPFREYIADNNSIVDVFDCYKPFKGAKDTRVHTVLISKFKIEGNIKIKQVFPSNTDIIYRNYKISNSIIRAYRGNEWRFYITEDERNIFNKMESVSEPLEKLFNIKYGLRTGDNAKYVSESKTEFPLIAGADIASLYKINWKPKYLQNIEDLPKGYFNEYYTEKKIIVQRIRTNSININARWIEAAYIEGKYIPNDSLTYLYEKSKDYSLMYLLGVLNTFLLNKYYRAYYTDVNVKPTYLAQLPIPKISIQQQRLFIEIVDKILTITKSNDYLENFTKKEEVKKYEKQIDQIVYKLYGLTPKEIQIIEKSLSQ